MIRVQNSAIHLSDYYANPQLSVERCALNSCGIKDYQANPPLKCCGGCKYVWYCSKAHSEKDWQKHRTLCAQVVRSNRMLETRVLSDPRQALLEQKIEKFIDSAGANEILFAAHCAFHLSHPSLPRIDQTHLLRLFVEVDPEASHKPLREQCRFDSYQLCTKKEFLAAHVAQGREIEEGDTCDRMRPENMRRLGPNDPNTGMEDGEYWVEVNGWWKGDKSGAVAVIARYCGVWIARTAPGTEREYEAIVADWFPFLQTTMKGPGQQFRHLFDRKVDLATRSFDFGSREDGQLPPKDSPGYQAARERLFEEVEWRRNGARQTLSVSHGHETFGGMGFSMGTMIATRRGGGSSFAIHNDGTGVRQTELEEPGQDLLEPMRKARKKAKKDQRKRDRKAREAAEAATAVSDGLSLDGLKLDEVSAKVES